MFVLPLVFLVPLCACMVLFIKRDSFNVDTVIAVAMKAALLTSVITVISIMSHTIGYETGSIIDIKLLSVVALSFDGLALSMIGFVSSIGLLTQYFSSWYLRAWFDTHADNASHFFTASQLLIASSLILILSNNLVLLYIAWQLVGFSCYLLMRLDYSSISPEHNIPSLTSSHDDTNIDANIDSDVNITTDNFVITSLKKDFVIKRIGDIALLVGMVLLFKAFGSVNMYHIIHTASALFMTNDMVLATAIMLITLGVVAKSAQLPLHTWLLNRSALPMPVLSLIQSVAVASMGVYVVARLHPLFLLTPDVLFWWFGTIGAVGVILTSMCALAHNDLKKILLYISVGQGGYVFIALAMGAWKVAVYHVLAYGFVASLLFLATASLIKSVHNETHLDSMSDFGNLREHNQPIFMSMLVGFGALISFPLISFGLYAQQSSLNTLYLESYHTLFYSAMIGLCLTSACAFKVIYKVFYTYNIHAIPKSLMDEFTAKQYTYPLMSLLLLSTFFMVSVSLPLADVFITTRLVEYPLNVVKAEFFALWSVLLGLCIAWYLYVVNESKLINSFINSSVGTAVQYWCYNDVGITFLYNSLLTKMTVLFYALCDKAGVSVKSNNKE